VTRLQRYIHETNEAWETRPDKRTLKQEHLVRVVLENSKITYNGVFKSEVK